MSKEMDSKEEAERTEMKKKPYRELIGCLIYLSKATRPNVAFCPDGPWYCADPGRSIGCWRRECSYTCKEL